MSINVFLIQQIFFFRKTAGRKRSLLQSSRQSGDVFVQDSKGCWTGHPQWQHWLLSEPVVSVPSSSHVVVLCSVTPEFICSVDSYWQTRSTVHDKYSVRLYRRVGVCVRIAISFGIAHYGKFSTTVRLQSFDWFLLSKKDRLRGAPKVTEPSRGWCLSYVMSRQKGNRRQFLFWLPISWWATLAPSPC